jgi:cytoplasmic iron level regulating protein YaaA (DUF328/UPF0246 family)
VRILLPPSEAKRRGGGGRALSARHLRVAGTDLLGPRAAVLAALERTLSGPAPDERLLLPASVAATALADNARVLTSPTMPAMLRYQGVVFEGLAASELSKAAQTLASSSLLIFSGLFGVLGAAEPIPAYRVPAKAKLDGIGVVGTYWQEHLRPVLPELLGKRHAVIDLRSSDYAGMWRAQPGSDLAERVISVRIISPKPDGSYGVVSFASKYAKGMLAAACLERAVGALGRFERSDVRSAADVAETWLSIGGLDAHVLPVRNGELVELITQTATLPPNPGRYQNAVPTG